MSWQNIPDNIEPYWGFIYEIKNLVTGKKYIGRCNFWTISKKCPGKYKLNKEGKFLKDKNNKRILETRTRKKWTKIETDWKNYWGSSGQLKEDIETLGEHQFSKTIIKLCELKWDCAYYEAKLQFDKDVLLRDDYYNGIINLRIPRRAGNNSKK